MNLLDEIRSDLVNESASLSNTLRKAKILANAIGLPEFREWVEYELNGYEGVGTENVPKYRHFKPTNLGTFTGPFQSMTRNMVLPTLHLPDELRDYAENQFFLHGVGELEALESSNSLSQRWPQEMVMLAREYIELSGGMVLIDAQQPIPSHLISGILDQVKNRLLDFVLGLQENNITSDDLERRTVATEVARNIFNNHIYGSGNIVASGENVSQRVKTVQKGDVGSLLNAIRELNVDERDVREIETAVSEEPIATDGQLGPQVKAWLGGVIAKMASGALSAGFNTTAVMLTKAIHDYYGINPSC